MVGEVTEPTALFERQKSTENSCAEQLVSTPLVSKHLSQSLIQIIISHF